MRRLRASVRPASLAFGSAALNWLLRDDWHMNEPGLSDKDLPQVFRAADLAAIGGRRSYMSQTGARLIAAVVAGAAGVSTLRLGGSATDVAGLISSAAFLAALVLDVSLLRSRPERAWYDGRTLAESAKTLAWKWAVGGSPYSLASGRGNPAVLLADDLRSLRSTVGAPKLEPVVGPVVSDAMRSLRAAPLDIRRQVYLVDRMQRSVAWYSEKASYSGRAARRWRALLLALEVTGGLLGVLKATGTVDLPLDAVLASALGAVGAWLEAQQHDRVADAYAVAIADLADAQVRLEAAQDEQAWAVAVNDSEDAISREHTRWRASRSEP